MKYQDFSDLFFKPRLQGFYEARTKPQTHKTQVNKQNKNAHLLVIHRIASFSDFLVNQTSTHPIYLILQDKYTQSTRL